MLAAGIKTPVPLEELESHLREEIERQMRAGTDMPVAFARAVSQIGKGTELKTEFFKTSRLHRLLHYEFINKEWESKWSPAGHVISYAIILLFYCAIVIWNTSAGLTSGERLAGLAGAAVTFLLVNAGLLGSRVLPVIVSQRKRMAVYAIGGFLIALGIMIFLARLNVGMGALIMALSWAFLAPLGAFSGFILGLEKAAQKKSTAMAS